MKKTINETDGFVDNINIKCSPVEYLLIKTALELFAENKEVSHKDIQRIKAMLIDMKAQA